MGTMSQTVQQRMGRFRYNQMKLEELTQPGWGDPADYFSECDKKYGTSEVRVPAVVTLQTDHNADALAPTAFRKLTESIDIVPRILQRPPWTSRPGSGYMRLGSGKPQSDTCIPGLVPAAEPDSSHMPKAKPVEPVRSHPCIEPPHLIAI